MNPHVNDKNARAIQEDVYGYAERGGLGGQVLMKERMGGKKDIYHPRLRIPRRVLYQ